MKNKKFHIGIDDYLLANRKAAREEEIRLHGKPVTFRPVKHKSKKTYSRKLKHKLP